MSTRDRSRTSCSARRAATGPRTAAGKMRSRLNARRHGLAIPIGLDQNVSDTVDNVAREIAGPSASDAVIQLARRVAEAQLDVIRCRQARCRTFEDKPDNEEGVWNEFFRDPVIMYFLLKKRADRAGSEGAPAPSLNDLPDETLDRVWDRALSRRRRRFTKELIAIDRYEQRALSRRNRALQNLDCQRLIEATTSKPA